MTHTKKDLQKSQVELLITVTPSEYEPHLQKAAKRLSERTAVKGFRKGHIPYDILKREVGEMVILQEAVQSIVQESYVNVIREEKIASIGAPEITVEKAAPGNDFVYKAVVALLPEVTLPALSKIRVKTTEATVSEEELKETIDALRGMHAEEIKKEGPAEGTDKLVLDMDMKIDNVPVEGGQTKGYQVYLGEKHYLPGFNDQVKGLSSGEEKTFPLSFPKDHYQKQFAGKTAQVSVSVKDVFERRLPELTDEFVQKLGQKSKDEFTELIRSNLTQEAVKKTEQKAEAAILETIIDKATFADIPDMLLQHERMKIFHELKRDLEKHGVTIEQYLEDIKRDEKELVAGFTAQAEKRAKAALVSRQVALEQNLTVSEEEIQKEIDLMRTAYEHNKEAQENLGRPEVHDAIATMLQNRKVMEWLKKEILK